jgi:uncharacterized protein
MNDLLQSKQIQDICVNNGIAYLGLFGSYANGTQNDSSDVDLLVEYSNKSPVQTLFDHLDVQFQLERILNKKIDLVTKRSLHPYIRENVLSNLKTVYEQ